MFRLVVVLLVVSSVVASSAPQHNNDEIAGAASEGFSVEDPNDLEVCTTCNTPTPSKNVISPSQSATPTRQLIMSARRIQDRLTSVSREELVARRGVVTANEAHTAMLLERRNKALDGVPYFWHHVLEASHRRDLMLMPLPQQELVAAQFGATNRLFRAVPLDDEALVQHHMSSLRCKQLRMGDTKYFNISIDFKKLATVEGETRRFPLLTTSWYRVLAAETPHRISNSQSDWEGPAGSGGTVRKERSDAQWKAEFGEGTALNFADEFQVNSKVRLTGVQADLRLGSKQAQNTLPVPGALVSMFSSKATLSHYTDEQQGIVKARLYTLVAEACGQLAAMPITLYEDYMMEREQASFMHEEDLAASQTIADLTANY